MAVFVCKQCGYSLGQPPQGATAVRCPACEVAQSVPRLGDARLENLYNRANHLRAHSEFDKALVLYEEILAEHATDADIYWSMVLCTYGIEYVEDPSSKTRKPTVHRAQYTSIFDDANYKMALEYGDRTQRALFEREAKVINEIQKGFFAISQKEEPFDVFICYKESDENGERTVDSTIAEELYELLIQAKCKVFFARITLEDKLGSAYEPYIFAALNSAKAMVVLGTKPEYFEAVWVKNEWSRFLAAARKDRTKLLIPVYGTSEPPKEFSHLQAQSMSKLGYQQDVVRFIKKHLQDVGVHAPAANASAPATSAAATVLKRAYMALEDGDFQAAIAHAERALDLDPENGEAYMLQLMAQLQVQRWDDLPQSVSEPCKQTALIQKIFRFADDGKKAELDAADVFVCERNTFASLQSLYTEVCPLLQGHDSVAFQKATALMKSAAFVPMIDEERYKRTIRNMGRHATWKDLVPQLQDMRRRSMEIKAFFDSHRQDADDKYKVCKDLEGLLKLNQETIRLCETEGKGVSAKAETQIHSRYEASRKAEKKARNRKIGELHGKWWVFWLALLLAFLYVGTVVIQLDVFLEDFSIAMHKNYGETEIYQKATEFFYDFNWVHGVDYDPYAVYLSDIENICAFTKLVVFTTQAVIIILEAIFLAKLLDKRLLFFDFIDYGKWLIGLIVPPLVIACYGDPTICLLWIVVLICFLVYCGADYFKKWGKEKQNYAYLIEKINAEEQHEQAKERGVRDKLATLAQVKQIAQENIRYLTQALDAIGSAPSAQEAVRIAAECTNRLRKFPTS